MIICIQFYLYGGFHASDTLVFNGSPHGYNFSTLFFVDPYSMLVLDILHDNKCGTIADSSSIIQSIMHSFIPVKVKDDR